MIRNRNKLTGGTIAVPETSIEEIDRMVRRAKDAFSSWQFSKFKERKELFENLRRVLKKQEKAITQVVREETGKPVQDFLFGEMVPVGNLIKFCCRKEIGDLLEKGEKAWAPPLFALRKKGIFYFPIGLAGIISSWNFPFSLAIGDSLEALIGGNVVILKHSSYTPLTSLLIRDLLREAGFPKDVFQVIIGPGSKVGELLAQKADGIYLTGGEKAGQRMMEIADSRGIRHLELELGGSNPAIVLSEANLERAANAIVWGRNANTGQACNSIKRVCVESAVYKEFLDLVREKVISLRPEIDYGPIIHEKELEKLTVLLEDAKNKGAEVDCGGEVLEINGNFYLTPTVLTDVNHFMRIMREECFGPIMPVMEVKDCSEALRLANDSPYGLGASIFAKKGDPRVGYLFRRLDVGTVNVNSVMDEFAMTGLPFVGRKASGWGSGRHSLEGIKRFLVAKGATIDSGFLKKELHWYPYSDKQLKLYKKFSKLGLV